MCVFDKAKSTPNKMRLFYIARSAERASITYFLLKYHDMVFTPIRSESLRQQIGLIGILNC